MASRKKLAPPIGGAEMIMEAGEEWDSVWPPAVSLVTLPVMPDGKRRLDWASA